MAHVTLNRAAKSERWPPNRRSPAALRVRRHRERRAAGRITVAVEIDEVEAVEALAAAKLLNPLRENDRSEIAHAIAKLLELLAHAR
jgi:hypothetical protein